jgi:hypothetical protein
MTIAIIGAGIFGATIAIKLADNGFEVDLIEKENDILQAASGINQYRLHRGYHYPRSKETGISSRESFSLFREYYKEAVIDKNQHYYCVPKKNSKVSGENFLQFCDESGLEYQRSALDILNEDLFDVIIEGKESLIDPIKLREVIYQKIKERKINLMLGRKATPEDIDDYDVVVNCTYANLNAILEKYPDAKREYQFEVCEKPVLKLPPRFKNISAVIMDGPFFCIDPYGDTDLHVMGSVVHAIHFVNEGFFPKVPDQLRSLINQGIVKNPLHSKINNFLESASYFMPEIKRAEHIGSMYTVRTVLPGVHHTDERPTIVTKVNDKVINVFSGKIGNCVKAAEEVLALLVSVEKPISDPTTRPHVKL